MTMPQMQSLKGKNRERRVPSSRIARFAQFGQLGMGLAFGAAAEIAKRTLGLNKVCLAVLENEMFFFYISYFGRFFLFFIQMLGYGCTL